MKRFLHLPDRARKGRNKGRVHTRDLASLHQLGKEPRENREENEECHDFS